MKLRAFWKRLHHLDAMFLNNIYLLLNNILSFWTPLFMEFLLQIFRVRCRFCVQILSFC